MSASELALKFAPSKEVKKNLMDIHSQAELQDLCDKLGVRPEQRTKKASVAQCLADELVREVDLSKAIEHAGLSKLQQAAAAFGGALALQGDVLLKGLSALCFVKLSLQQNLQGKLGGKELEEQCDPIAAPWNKLKDLLSWPISNAGVYVADPRTVAGIAGNP